MASIDQFLASLEADFGESGKGKPFEVFCKWFLENDPEWSGSIEKVWAMTMWFSQSCEPYNCPNTQTKLEASLYQTCIVTAWWDPEFNTFRSKDGEIRLSGLNQ